jgi:hypothetical protein
MIMKLERFMTRSIVARYPGLSRKGIRAIINGVRNDSKNEQEIEFLDEKTSHRRTNEASAIRTAIQEHRPVSELVNPAGNVSGMEKEKQRCYPLILRYFVCLDRELDPKANMELGVEQNVESEKRKGILTGKRFSVVALCITKFHFVTIDSRVLNGIMKEVCLEFDVRKIEFTSENRETYWKNIFNFKRLNTCKQKVFTGIIETDGVAMCVHSRRLKADRPVPSSTAPLAKHEENKEAGLTTQEVQENDFVVGTDPGNTNIVTIAVCKRAEDDIDGNLRQKDIRL